MTLIILISKDSQQKPNQFKNLKINVFPATSTFFHSKSVTLHPYFF